MKTKKKWEAGIFSFLFVFFSCQFTFAQSPANYRWLSTYFELNRIFDEENTKVKEIQESIEKDKQIISQTEKIIRQAKQGDPDAKKNEMNAFVLQQQVQETLRINEKLLEQTQLKKENTQRMMAYLQNMAKGAFDAKIKGFITDFKGDVQIFKSNGQIFYVNDNNFGLLESGDKIITYGNSYAKVSFLDGRANAVVDEFSELKVEKETEKEEILTLINGKIYSALDKIGAFIDKTKKEFETYKNMTSSDIEFSQEELRKMSDKVLQLKLKNRSGKPDWTIGVRGTRFAIENNPEGNGILSVFEDTVDVFLPQNKTLAVPAGYKVIFSEDSVSQPQKNDTIDEWWKNKQ